MAALFSPDHPWVLSDNRRHRSYNTLTAGALNARCAASLPAALIAGKTILDLGSCIGAAGWWAIENGASFYCGVEAQSAYAETAKRLFATHLSEARYELIQDDLVRFLETDRRAFDLVLLAGVIYGFVDPLYPLRLCAGRARMIVVDTAYPLSMPDGGDHAYMDFVADQQMVLARPDTRHASGAGALISPRGLDVVMANLGFAAEAVKVAPIPDCEDVYNTPRLNQAGGHYPLRYVRRYVQSGERLLSVGEEVAAGRVSSLAEMYDPDACGYPRAA